jgi:large subunit ribosomal protein L21
MYAIIEQGGKQQKVTTGDRLLLDQKVAEGTTTVTLDRVLMVGGEGEPKVGTPVVAGATVTAEVLGETKGKKIDSYKYNRRKGYHKRVGHRQQYTEVRVTAINA